MSVRIEEKASVSLEGKYEVEKKKQHRQKPWIFHKKGNDVWHCSETISISETQEKKNVKPLMIKDENRGVGVRYSAGEFGFYYKQSRKPLIV